MSDPSRPFSAIPPPATRPTPFRRPLLVRRVQTWGVRIARSGQQKLPAACENLCFFGGLVAMVGGCWMAWHPLGPLVGGGIAVWLSLMISVERSAK